MHRNQFVLVSLCCVSSRGERARSMFFAVVALLTLGLIFDLVGQVYAFVMQRYITFERLDYESKK